MDTWFPPPLTAYEMEARRAAAEEGRFPPSEPAMVPAQNSQNAVYNSFPRSLSRSCSQSSSGTPPPYSQDRQNILPTPTHADSGILHRSHPSCPTQFLPVSVYNEDFIYQPEWKADHQPEYMSQPANYSVVYPDPRHQDLQLRKRSINAIQARPIVNHGFHQAYSPSSSPLSGYDQVRVGALNPMVHEYPSNYTFINQVFKPLYKTDEEKDLDPQSSHPVGRDGKSSQPNNLTPMMNNSSTKDRPSDRYPRSVVPGGRKPKRSNEKRFPCPDCGRMFARAFNMVTHRKTHIGYRPHHCPQCQKNFSRRHDLHRHLAAVHNEQTKSHPQTSGASPQGFNSALSPRGSQMDANKTCHDTVDEDVCPR